MNERSKLPFFVCKKCPYVKPVLSKIAIGGIETVTCAHEKICKFVMMNCREELAEEEYAAFMSEVAEHR